MTPLGEEGGPDRATRTAARTVLALALPRAGSGQDIGQALRSPQSLRRVIIRRMVTAIAATLTTFDRIAKVPATTWWTLAAIIAGIFVVVPLIRKLRQISGIWITFGLFLGVVLLSAHWIYHRTEPAILKPFVDVVAPFFPTKAPPRR